MSGVKGRSGRKPEPPELHFKNIMRRTIRDDEWSSIFRKLADQALAGSAAHAKLLLAYMFGAPKVLDAPSHFKSRMGMPDIPNPLELLQEYGDSMLYEPEVFHAHANDQHGDPLALEPGTLEAHMKQQNGDDFKNGESAGS